MAADDAGERTEDPTSRRLGEAREEGQLPKSPDLTAAIGLLTALVLLQIYGHGLMTKFLELTFSIGQFEDLQGDELLTWSRRLVSPALLALLPFLLFLLFATAVGTALQSGIYPSLKRLQPKLSKLNPINGFKRLFSVSSVMRLLQGVLKMVIVGAVAWFTITEDISSVLAAGTLGARGILHLCSTLIFKLALRLAIVLLVLAILDYIYQRWNWWRNLKMTKQEVKDEYKRMEGDPQMRSRRRRAQLQLAMQRINADVPKADVVVTNPTEYAVALRYDEQAMAAPRVVAKGQDLLALRIRQVAQQHGVPIVQRPPLARALYAAVEVGQEVPPAFYRAVAELLAYVYQLTGRRAG